MNSKYCHLCNNREPGAVGEMYHSWCFGAGFFWRSGSDNETRRTWGRFLSHHWGIFVCFIFSMFGCN